MKNVYIGYRSKNGIRFHHSKNTFEDAEKESVLLEAHHMCEVFLLLSGSVTYLIDGKAYKPAPMEMLIVAPHELHSVQIENTEPYERMVLHFDINLLPAFSELDLLRPFQNPKNFAHIVPKQTVEKYGLLDHMQVFKRICIEKKKYSDLNLLSAIIKFTRVMNDMIDDLVIPLSEKASSRNDTISSLCIHYINEHLTENFTAANVAKALNLSASHMQHTFKKEMGVTLHYYIFMQKMQLANQMLAQGQPAQSVADALGYESYSTFYLNFVKRFGIPPNELMKINKHFYSSDYDEDNLS